MSEPIKPGDMVMLIWACCALGRSHIGWVGEVEGLVECKSVRCSCRHVTCGRHAWITIDGGRGVVPLSWLRKMPPQGERQDVQREEEIAA